MSDKNIIAKEEGLENMTQTDNSQTLLANNPKITTLPDGFGLMENMTQTDNSQTLLANNPKITALPEGLTVVTGLNQAN